MIGIVGGVGSYAGLDLAQKIFDATEAKKDQDHLPVLLHSIPAKIADRTDFLLGETKENPAYAVAHIIKGLAESGATVVGIPCNTMHAPPMWEVIESELGSSDITVTLVHMIQEVTKVLSENRSGTKVGVLSTTGTYSTRLYPEELTKAGFEVVEHSQSEQEQVHQAIYSTDYGIKAFSNPVRDNAKKHLDQVAGSMFSRGASSVILGCTELPLAFQEKLHTNANTFIDPTTILANALIREYKKS